MKQTITTLCLIAFGALSVFNSCKDDPVYIPPNYTDGVDYGEDVTIPGGNVGNTVNVEGGDLTVTGNTKVTADINVKQEGSDVIIADVVDLHKVNMHAGNIYFVGSPTINTDFNVNGGNVYVGNEYSKPTDTVTIKNNFNLYDTLWVRGGVLVIGTDFNMFSFVNISDSAKVIVKHNFNKSADLYGNRNIEVKGQYHNNSGLIVEEPWQLGVIP